MITVNNNNMKIYSDLHKAYKFAVIGMLERGYTVSVSDSYREKEYISESDDYLEIRKYMDNLDETRIDFYKNGEYVCECLNLHYNDDSETICDMWGKYQELEEVCEIYHKAFK